MSSLYWQEERRRRQAKNSFLLYQFSYPCQKTTAADEYGKHANEMDVYGWLSFLVHFQFIRPTTFLRHKRKRNKNIAHKDVAPRLSRASISTYTICPKHFTLPKINAQYSLYMYGWVGVVENTFIVIFINWAFHSIPSRRRCAVKGDDNDGGASLWVKWSAFGGCLYFLQNTIIGLTINSSITTEALPPNFVLFCCGKEFDVATKMYKDPYYWHHSSPALRSMVRVL